MWLWPPRGGRLSNANHGGRMTTIGIAGAGGELGRRVAELVLATTDPAQVVLVSQLPGELEYLGERGAQVRACDFDAPATLEDAFAGVDRLLLVSTDAVGRRTAEHVAAVLAAKAVGVSHLAYTSLPNAGAVDHPLGVIAVEHAETERAIIDSGLDWTFLRNGVYVDPLLDVWADAVAKGALVNNAGDGRTAFVTRDDCAAAAAAVLTGEGHERQAYDITGPNLLTLFDVAALLSDITGRVVETVRLDDDAYVARLVGAGVPESFARISAEFGIAIRRGLLEAHTGALERLTGRAATSVADYLAANREALAPR
ncbi:NAD(P)H-binding protein [Solirubrobacter ginsenosidimutans]|uniref:NAD(P)H-binding protein n=1 Tax=Solirubrobacter ginsenosidimutans TaxID=490573 RepID=A0A9X3N4G1_9ACTN|nr:NAD(P)H-binding protein [Solirubrobacter ginsenosidimutans]MDA0166835.1 NAD(P)H-binding protein [Solirubrobacter ginsenosidimutans]